MFRYKSIWLWQTGILPPHVSLSCCIKLSESFINNGQHNHRLKISSSKYICNGIYLFPAHNLYFNCLHIQSSSMYISHEDSFACWWSFQRLNTNLWFVNGNCTFKSPSLIVEPVSHGGITDSDWKHTEGFLFTQLFFILSIALTSIRKPSTMYLWVNYG